MTSTTPSDQPNLTPEPNLHPESNLPPESSPQVESTEQPEPMPQSEPGLQPQSDLQLGSSPVPESNLQPESSPQVESAQQPEPAPQPENNLQPESSPQEESAQQPEPTPRLELIPPPEAQVKAVTRFGLLQRIEHIVLLASFTTLAATGLPQKFATVPISQFVIGLFGGIESIRIVHHIAAIILMTLSIYHVVEVLYRVFVKRVSWTMLPVVEDFKHLYHDLLFYFGRRKHKAYYGRYSYAEKAEYLAVVWGTLIMIITGFMMWNPIATTNILPGQAIPAAKVAHGGEAVLAVLAIILWHFYHVHLRHFNKSMFTGELTRDEMKHEHPAELALIEAGKTPKEPEPKVLRRRQSIFYPIAGVLVIVSSITLFRFVTFEKTAIDTVPIEVTGQVFVPFTPTPTPTFAPTPTLGPITPTPAVQVVDTWDTTISQLFNTKCAACHIQSQSGGLSLKTYADALKGGADGPAIVPNDPDKSVLVKIQSAGGHPGQLTAEELATVVAWITAGAIEQPGAITSLPATTTEGWTGGIDQIINAKCAACHIQSQSGGLSLKTYADALKGGADGPAIVPNDPDKSVLVKIQSAGGHPGQLTAEELATVVAWIKAGAPEQSGATSSPVPTPAAPAPAKWSDFEPTLNLKCGTCHVKVQLGGLSFKTYADILKGGKSGPAVVPGNPDKSVLVQVMRVGDHANVLSTQELEVIIAWIKAGAPEQGGAATPPSTPTAGGEGWTGGIDQIITAKCAACHIQSQSGGLLLKTYADALKGGADGPAIVPNDPDKSVLVKVQSAGGHPGQLSTDELQRIIAWIKAGAPENPASSSTAPPAANVVWAGGIDQIITAKCAACHIQSQSGGLSLKTYADALKGGTDGPVIVPNDPDKSMLVKIQQAGGHPGQLSADELALIIAWIKAGAPE